MRFILFSVISLITLLPVSSMAIEPVNEAHAMFYYQVPFSTSKVEQKKHSFGFRMDHTSYERGEMIQYQKLMNRTAAFDFRMGHQGVEAVMVSGVDFLQPYRLARAAEDEAAGDEDMSMDEGEASEKEKEPGTLSRTGTDIANTIDDIISVVPLGFIIGGAIAVVLISGAGG